jgi:uncharacterized protein (TIGR03437 family)
MPFLFHCGCMVIGASALFGQGISLVGAGYVNPAAIRVSPGQITTIFVSGLKPDFSKPQMATTLPLPSTLAGTAVSINQPSSMQSFVAPLFSVRQSNNCGSSVFGPTSQQPAPIPQDCLLTAITLQIPYELSAGSGSNPLSAELVITSNGVTSKAFSVLMVLDNMHVLTTCDQKQDGAIVNGCYPIVTHADGTPVTVDFPANQGETVVIYAFGLGHTVPAVRSGEVTPSNAPILGPVFGPFARTVSVDFDFRPNAGPSKTYLFNVAQSNPSTHALVELPSNPVRFVGLTPGQVGLYQINLELPAKFPAVLPCGLTMLDGNSSGPTNLYSLVQSNLTIDIGPSVSFDGAAICVQPPK